ncbi:exodeoxyribonuclease VII large subunit [Listeria fleischmannii]|uniref:Exodeoxyribonuclease 7 large subunit n=1 Tax=Listeria fleischmannii TaxID=1069827 RepID=A0A841YI38_9LIST|nr:exodeoxyribonuclease VII large subunit [Listeria fleischmannii]MBC1428028.1 exodeoxyribonuclease VII large subunit [Listeria fleischmannii]
MILQEKYLTVEALTKYIERKFEADPYLKQVFVKGEISNLKTPASGHIYFTLKDEAAMLRSVMFAKSVAKLPFRPEDGMNVLVIGRVSVFNKAGRYQFYVDSMEPDGVGALYVQFEQLKAKLDKEGLFDARHKKVLPSFPSKIAVVTSGTGAAIRDILTTLHRRMPNVEVLVYPTLVQGDTAAQKIAQNIARINARNDIDLMIIGRGGGSLEELWAFNEEIVVRSVFDSDVPVISAVGHETDFSLADFAADVRAATPTAAAELAVPHQKDLTERLLERRYRLTNLMRQTFERSEVNLAAKRDRLLLRGPRKLMDEQTERLDYFSGRMENAFARVLWQKETQLTQLSNRIELVSTKQLVVDARRDTLDMAKRLQVAAADIVKSKRYEFEKHISALELLSPLSLLKRGYGVTYQAGELVKEVSQLELGDEVKVVLSDGAFTANVTSKEEEK